MSDIIIEPNNCYNIDCNIGMELMLRQGLKADWCITDPPYGINAGNVGKKGYKEQNGGVAERRDYSVKEWDVNRIGGGCFNLIYQCSNNQIIFGGNYYTDILAPTKSWIIWDKRMPNKADRNNFADCELAWCSQGQARVFNYLFNGMLQDNPKCKDFRFHPTQKPTQLWSMLLNYYTKENDLILDCFAGSQSLRVACYKTNRRYIGFEIDKEYYDKGCEWFNQVSAQTSIFDFL